MSLVTYPKSPQDVTQSEALLLPIAEAINNYWQPIKTWTTIALTISQNGLTLSIATTALLITLLIYRLFQNQQEKTSLLRLYTKLPTQTQQLINAIQNAQNNPTKNQITQELQKLTNQPTDQTWLDQKLQEMENAGLIAKKIANKNDIPSIAWKSQIQKTNPLQNIAHSLHKSPKKSNNLFSQRKPGGDFQHE
jgi:DNA-binding HxlR family transcriptional regulator